MSTVKSRKGYLNYIAISLAVVFLISASLFFLKIWENKQGRYPEMTIVDDVVTYDGKEYVLNENVETFLALGLDKYEGNDSWNNGNQADFLMLFVFDNDAKKSTALQISRDTMVNVNRLDIGGNKIDSSVQQIALAYNYLYDDSGKLSCRNTADSVSDLLMGINVDHYTSFTMDSVAIVNDLVGGVEVTVQDDFSGIDPSLVKGKTVTLKGEQALTYVRSRSGLEDSSNTTRMVRQRQYVQSLYEKTVTCMDADPEFAIRLADAVDEYVVYDSTNYRMQEFMKKFQEYEFTGIKELQGETVVGKQFMEFYPDEVLLQQTIIDLFYKLKN
jgi:LCP family protein required for cell wall assembly